MDEVAEAIKSAHRNDYNTYLKVFYDIDSATIDGMDESIQDAIEKSSLAIQRHKNSKWVDDSYNIIGKSRYYLGDFRNAIETFKYVNTTSEDDEARHRALISLMRTFIDNKEENNAIAVSEFLNKETLNDENSRDLALTRAYLHQTRGEYISMAPYLLTAVELVDSGEPKARIHYLLGQLYQKAGRGDEAYYHFYQSMKSNPPYELYFQARLKAAEALGVGDSDEVDKLRTFYKKLLRDDKNLEYHGKIYYERARFEQRLGNLDQAIDFYKESVRESTQEPLQKAYSYLALAEIYYDSLADYPMAKLYYDSTITVYPEEQRRYAAIKQRQEILGEFVEQLTILNEQDSLLQVAAMDSMQVMVLINTQIEEEEALRRQLERDERRRQAKVDDRGPGFQSGDNGTGFSVGGNNNPGGEWYFYNSVALARGQDNFRKTWGNRPLEDYWRLGSKRPENTFADSQNAGGSPEANTIDTPITPDNTGTSAEEDALASRRQELYSNIPFSPAAKEQANKKIEEAYFALGNIYKYKLREQENAVEMFDNLLTRYPQSEHVPEVLYLLYLTFKDSDPALANSYKKRLIDQYPDTLFAKMAENPNYQEETQIANAALRKVYEDAYQMYRQNNFETATAMLDDGLAQYPETDVEPKARLLQILIEGKTGTSEVYKNRLEGFIEMYPEEEITAYAQRLLTSASAAESAIANAGAIRYVPDFDQEHLFVMIVDRGVAINRMLSKMQSYNRTTFPDQTLNTGSMTYDKDRQMLIVRGIEGRQKAVRYYEMFNGESAPLREFGSDNFANFVVTKDNFQLFQENQDLENYLRFFYTNY
ncbi:tetratricopeptide repeat protein [Roseivirga sp. BDSF3-8]|uniref:type IX secretion system periplasmic lipoprotein PorW/SprE n=1 Tax=Roseivirga sp. BDSF3-8 TaxID=3241598 RepID=UPI0035318018